MIANTEQRLGCGLPSELKKYYRNAVNGTEALDDMLPFMKGWMFFYTRELWVLLIIFL